MVRLSAFLISLALGVASIHPAGAASRTAVNDVAARPVARPVAPPQRIVIGSGPLLHAVMAIEGAAGVEDRGTSRIMAVGADFAGRDKAGHALLSRRYPALATMPSVTFGEMAGLDNAAVLALRPDLAILSGTEATPREGSLAQALMAAGVPVVLTDFRSHPGGNGMPSLRAIATALGHDPDTNGFVRFHVQEMARVTDVTGKLTPQERPRAFMDMRADPAKDCCGTPGKGNYGELIEAAGAINVGGELHDKPLGAADAAAVLAARPDIYIAGSSNGGGVPLGRGVEPVQARQALRDLIAKRTALASLPAMREGRGFAVWHSFYNHPFHVAVVQAMARHFHPERFAGLDPEATLARAYAFIGVEPGGTYWAATPR